MAAKKKTLTSRKRADRLTYMLFLAPALLSFLLVIAVPFFMGIYFSLTNWTGITQSGFDFVGLQNYINSIKDIRFQYSSMITIVFALINFISVNVVAFSLALLVSSKIKGRNIYRTGFFLPNLIGGIVLGYIWQFIFNNVLISIGENYGISLLANTFFLTDPKLAVLALVIAGTWQYAGYIMMIYYTALQNVPKELLESADLDGANAWQRLRHITIPMIMPAFTVALFLTLSSSFKSYDVVMSLTNGGPSMLWQG